MQWDEKEGYKYLKGIKTLIPHSKLQIEISWCLKECKDWNWEIGWRGIKTRNKLLL